MQKFSSASCNINYHFVWCIKYRKPAFSAELRKLTESILRTISSARGWIIHEIKVNPDHIHIFLSAPPYDSPTGIIRVLKGISAQELFRQKPMLRKILKRGHLWSPSYYVGTAGNVSAAVIERYIREQRGSGKTRTNLNSSPHK